MGWKISDAILQARQLVQDTRTASLRHSDEKLIGYFNSAMSDVRKLRPDLFLGTSSASLWTDIPFFTVSNLPDDFPLDTQYFSPVVDYVAGMVGMEDDEYSNDGRAVGLQNRFAMKLSGKGV